MEVIAYRLINNCQVTQATNIRRLTGNLAPVKPIVMGDGSNVNDNDVRMPIVITEKILEIIFNVYQQISVQITEYLKLYCVQEESKENKLHIVNAGRFDRYPITATFKAFIVWPLLQNIGCFIS